MPLHITSSHRSRTCMCLSIQNYSRRELPSSAQRLMSPTRIHEWASLRGLRIRCCHELWCRSQTQLQSRIALAVMQASSYSSYSTPAWELPYAASAVLRNKQTKLQQESKLHCWGQQGYPNSLQRTHPVRSKVWSKQDHSKEIIGKS